MIAKMALASAEEESVNQVVYIGGDTILYFRLADTLDRTFQTNSHMEEQDLSLLRERFEGDPGDAICKYQTVFAEGKGVS